MTHANDADELELDAAPALAELAELPGDAPPEDVLPWAGAPKAPAAPAMPPTPATAPKVSSEEKLRGELLQARVALFGAQHELAKLRLELARAEFVSFGQSLAAKHGVPFPIDIKDDLSIVTAGG